jgi:uncharacterized membrane protein YbaN (DUF454 family)
MNESLFFGLNLAVILSIVGITEKLKEFLPIPKDKKIYLLSPLVQSLLFSLFLTTPFVWQTFLLNTVLYFSISTLFYDTVIQYVEKQKERLNEE